MATEKQISANRANAAKSTGPRTAKGKAASSANAFKHGIYAKSVLLDGEDPAEYQALRDGYYQDFQPATTDERELLEDVIKNRWKLNRLQATYTQMWNFSLESDADNEYRRPHLPLVRTFNWLADNFANLRRETSAAERAFHRARTALIKAQSDRAKLASFHQESPHAEPIPAPVATPPVPPQIGFVPANLRTAVSPTAKPQCPAIAPAPDPWPLAPRAKLAPTPDPRPLTPIQAPTCKVVDIFYLQ